MAWITKNSASAQIERRDEPYLTQQMQDKLASEVLPRYATKHAALLPCLHEVQHAYGWIPHQALEEIANFLDLKPADVLDTASFYEEYWLEPKGRNLVGVCRSIACEFCGQCQISDAIKDHLGIEVGETTDDDTFTLIELECIGACGGAPAALVNETLYEDLKVDDIPALLDETAAGRQPPGTPGHH